MTCATCGCVFCFDGAYGPWNAIPLPPDCPVCRCAKRGKKRYPSLAAATAAHASKCLASAQFGGGYAYPCGDHWHLSRHDGPSSVRLERPLRPRELWQEQLAALKEIL